MTFQTIPVSVVNGVVRSLDGTPLPEHANALLVIIPATTEREDLEDWQRPFDDFFEQVRQNPLAHSLDPVSDTELNERVHAARRQ